MLKNKIIDYINKNDIIPFDKFMDMCLSDEQYGYYKIKNPFGIQGDFITAPEISQIFGEVLAFWIADVWANLHHPSVFNIVELGAGKGTLMTDILRALRVLPKELQTINIHIVEINETLEEIQRDALKDYHNITWYKNLSTLNLNAPTVFISNEFFDALPTKQYLLENNMWYELYVQTNGCELDYAFNKCSNNNVNMPILKYIQQDIPLEIPTPIYEISNLANVCFSKIINILKKINGAFLTIDYAYQNLPYKSTIRGYKNHTLLSQKDLLANVGTADITYNVNFQNFMNIAKESGVNLYKLQTQKEFLENSGIHERTANLIKTMGNSMQKEIFSEGDKEALLKSTDMLTNPDKMGNIFKVIAVSYGLDSLANFEKI